MLATLSIVFDPVTPWSLPTVGVPALLIVAGFIAVVTLLTYLVGSRGGWGRFLVMLALRLTALGVVCLMLLRPSLARFEIVAVPSKLLIVVDASRSMSVQDSFNNQTRWKNALRLLQSESVQALLKKLQTQQRMEILYYQAAVDVKSFNRDGSPNGVRTEMGLWLHQLYKKHGGKEKLRGVLLITDGADNGTSPFLAVKEARKWRSVCPIYTLGLGSPKTTPKRQDIYFETDKIDITPKPLYVKGKMTVRTVVHAPGFQFARVKAQLLIDGKEIHHEEVVLEKTKDNEIELVGDAPVARGDYKVTVRLEPQDREVSHENNEISTYVTVIKEGLSVLWVEGKKRLESRQIINQVLKRDRRIRHYFIEWVKGVDDDKSRLDEYQFQNRHYDVVVIGDISGKRFCGGDPRVFEQLHDMVKNKGTGVLMMGGFETLGHADWSKYDAFTQMLPVTWDRPQDLGQIRQSVQVVPTPKGVEHFLMKLSDDPRRNEAIWMSGDYFKRLEGATRIGTVRGTSSTLAKIDGDIPIMAYNDFGKGRVLVFGADTTHVDWCPFLFNQPDPRIAHKLWRKFWTRTIRWLAHQEDLSSDVWVKLGVRRLPAGAHQNVGITVGLRNEKKEARDKKVQFRVYVTRPDRKRSEVPVLPVNEKKDREQRGFFWQTNTPGEYEVEVEAVDEQGKRISEPAKARFLAYPEDLENLRPAANYDHLTRIAQDSGGQFRQAGERELKELLQDIAEQNAPQSRPQGDVWPEWNREPETDTISDQLSAMWSSGVLVGYFVFCTLICVEWFVRRRWDLV